MNVLIAARGNTSPQATGAALFKDGAKTLTW